MPTPGTTVTVTAATQSNHPLSSLGTAFFIGQAASGPVGTAVLITSLSQYVSIFGARTFNGATPTLYDAVDSFFLEGGQQCYISRVSGANGAVATHTLVDKAGSPLSTLSISAMGPGTYGNAITVAVSAGIPSNSYILTITNGSVLEISPALNSPQDAVNWAQVFSKTVVIANLGSATTAPNNNPVNVSAVNLAGGVDDTSPTDAVWVTALTAFPLDLGMGQVCAPLRTTAAVWEALIEHAQVFNRFALLDGENTATAAQIIADAETVQASVPDPSYGIMLAAYPIYPGVPTGTATPPYPRLIAPSGPVCGAMALLASMSKNGDVAAAGNNGFFNHSTGVTQTYNYSDRGLLEAAGIGVIRDYKGNVQLYGYSSLALDPNWSDAGNCRLRMQIIDAVRDIGDNYMFADIDGQGHTASALGGDISAFLLGLYNQDALFGATAKDAFSVNVGASVNTPVTAQERELIAQCAVRMSPTALQVLIDVTRYPVTQSIPS